VVADCWADCWLTGRESGKKGVWANENKEKKLKIREKMVFILCVIQFINWSVKSIHRFSVDG